MSKFRPTHGESIRSMNSQVLAELLDQQVRLRLDQQRHLELLGHFDAGHQLVVKDLGGLRPRSGPASSGPPGSVVMFGAPISLASCQCPLGVLAADGPVVRIGIGPAGVPVRLPRIGDGVHHEGVDVGDRQVVPGQRIANRLLPLLQQPGRPGVRHVGQHLDARVAQAGDLLDRLLDREVHVGVGAESEFHGGGWQERQMRQRGAATDESSSRSARKPRATRSVAGTWGSGVAAVRSAR